MGVSGAGSATEWKLKQLVLQKTDYTSRIFRPAALHDVKVCLRVELAGRASCSDQDRHLFCSALQETFQHV